MGSAKKKPMTKKERAERRRKHKEKRLKKQSLRDESIDQHAILLRSVASFLAVFCLDMDPLILE